jgi:hypothetical protein
MWIGALKFRIYGKIFSFCRVDMATTLSFDKGKDNEAVAVVRGGDYDGEVLYLHKPDEKKVRALPKKEFNPTKYAPQLRGVKSADRVRLINKINEAVEKNAEELIGEPQNIKDLYLLIKRDMEKDKSIELPDGSIYEPIPNPDKEVRQIWYCAGASGSGKSYFAKKIAENYKKLFPDREVYLISKLEKDETLDNMKGGAPHRISLESLKKDYPALDEFEDCLVIFDDYDTLQPPYDKIVQQLIDDLAIQGRHTRTSMCVLSHYLTNYKKTRLILGEAHYLVLYPMATSFKALQYVCQTHCGLSKEEIQGLKKLGRWVMVHKVFPQYLIAPHTAYLLNQ